NHLFRDFVESVVTQPAPAAIRWTRPLNRPRKVLMVSSPIGLGHTRRDLAIAQELHALRPDVQVDWLAQAPTSDVVEGAGETLPPAATVLASGGEHTGAAP